MESGEANEAALVGYYDCAKDEQHERTEEVLRWTIERLFALLGTQRQELLDRGEEFNEMQRQVGAMTYELNQKRQETENLREELKVTKRDLACYQNTTAGTQHSARAREAGEKEGDAKNRREEQEPDKTSRK